MKVGGYHLRIFSLFQMTMVGEDLYCICLLKWWGLNFSNTWQLYEKNTKDTVIIENMQLTTERMWTYRLGYGKLFETKQNVNDLSLRRNHLLVFMHSDVFIVSQKEPPVALHLPFESVALKHQLHFSTLQGYTVISVWVHDKKSMVPTRDPGWKIATPVTK